MAINFTLTLFILLGSSYSYSCSLKRDIVSLSGPTTLLMEELDLLTDPHLKAISIFHPLKDQQNFRGNVLAGGLFLSPKILSKYENAIVFYDKSRELKKILKKSNIERIIVMATRGKGPYIVVNDLIDKLNPFLNKCELKIKELKSSLEIKLDKELHRNKIIFFLGRIKKGNRFPKLVISNDGAVLFLKNNFKKFKTYNSHLGYVPWSAKQIKGYSNYTFIGLSESKKDEISIEKVKENQYNLRYRGVLTPGISQITFIKKFLKLKF